MVQAMLEVPSTIDLPLRTDEDGTIRVGKTRVLMVVLIGAYRRGDTLEEIHEGFPTVSLPEILAVLAYYEANREQVDEYIRQIHERAAAARQAFEAEHPPKPLTREMLEARLEAKRKLEQE